jgi:hypothetical protein
VKPPTTGEYFVRVRGSLPVDDGPYTLAATTDAAPAGAIRVGETVVGTLTTSDSQRAGRPREEWSYLGTPGEEVHVSLASMQMSPILTFGCWNSAGVWETLASSAHALGQNAEFVVRVGGDCSIRVESSDYADLRISPQSYRLSVFTAAPSTPRM